MDTWSILRSFVIFYERGNLVYFSRFGILYQEKSGNPGRKEFEPGSDFGFSHTSDLLHSPPPPDIVLAPPYSPRLTLGNRQVRLLHKETISHPK
jgi:hypothetical protein